MKPAPILIALLLALPAVLAEAEGGAVIPCAAGLRTMPGVGLVCPRPEGVYEVFDPTGASLGYVHGTDPASGAEGPVGAQLGTSPKCVSGAATTYFVQVIYARATDDVDQYDARVGTIRSLVGNANKLVDDAAAATGSRADLNVKCVDGIVEVKNETLPTAMADASFSTIVRDLRVLGYNDGRVKYWIYYDDPGACPCGGTGHIYLDETSAASNSNNGNRESMFAVNFGYASTRIWLHELGHNMGAVQLGAAHTTGAGHCIDGLDIMCYDDGGWNGANYTTSACSAEVFDCGKDDYFHASPAAGSYLALRWNVGSRVNRFITFGTPFLTGLTCPSAVEVGTEASCTFLATDDSSGVRYAIEWGDGTTTHVPSASEFTPPGVLQNASHTYATAGTMRVNVSVVDVEGLVGNRLAKNVTAALDKTPPTLQILAPTPGNVYQGCAARAVPGARATYLDRGCVRVIASDTKSGVQRVDVSIDNVLLQTDFFPPYQLEFAVPSTQLAQKVTISVTDVAQNTATATIEVDTIRLIGR